MAIADDVLIDFTNKRIYGEATFLSGSTYYTVNEFYTYVMTLTDDAANIDDTVPFSQGSNVLTYIIANGWYIQRALIKHLKGASIQTDGYEDEIRCLTLSGTAQNIVAGDVGYAITGGTTGDSGVLLDLDGNDAWIRMDDSGDLFDDIDETVTCNAHTATVGGSASVTGECLFSNIVSVGSIAHGFCHIAQNGVVLTSWWAYGNSGAGNRHIDILVETTKAGTEIDSGNLTVFNRNLGDTYSHVTVDCSGGGRNVAPIATQTDINIYDSEGACDAGGDGNTLVDAAADFVTDGVQAGDVVWNETDGSYATVSSVTDLHTLETSSLLYGSDNLFSNGDSYRLIRAGYIKDYVSSTHGGDGTTEEILVTYDSYTADVDDDTVNENYAYRVDEEGQSQTMVYNALQWITARGRTQTLDGVAAQIYTSADAGYTPKSSAPLGEMAGSTLIFAQGGYPIDTGTGSYIATDTGNVQHTPPTTMSVAVTGLVSGDRVGVFLADAGAVDKTQFTSHATDNDIGDSTFIIQETIPKDVPQSGYIRVVDNTGNTEQRYAYSSWTGSTFTLNGVTLTVNYTGSDTAYVPWIDEAASSSSITKAGLQYVSDRSVIVRVRNSAPGGNQIIPYEVQATIASTGLSIPASRSPDNVIGN